MFDSKGKWIQYDFLRPPPMWFNYREPEKSIPINLYSAFDHTDETFINEDKTVIAEVKHD